MLFSFLIFLIMSGIKYPSLCFGPVMLKILAIPILKKNLFLLSIILELFHYIIPDRMFQFSDLLGNFLGVLVIYFLYNIKKKYE